MGIITNLWRLGGSSTRRRSKRRRIRWEEQEEYHHQEFSHLHQAQPEEQKQKHLLCYQKEEQWQGGCSRGWEDGLELEPLHLGAQGSHTNMKGPQMVWVPKETWSPRTASGNLETSPTRWCEESSKETKCTSWTYVSLVTHKVNGLMVARFKFMHHIAPLLCLGCLYALHILVFLYMVGLLCLTLTHEQPT